MMEVQKRLRGGRIADLKQKRGQRRVNTMTGEE